MRILPNGQVEITNFDTNETKVVKPEELPNYGISIRAYQDMKDIQPGGTKDINAKLQEVNLKDKLAEQAYNEAAKNNPLKLTFDPNRSATEQLQEALNSDFKITGGKRSQDIKDFYATDIALEKESKSKMATEKKQNTERLGIIDQTLTLLDELRDITKEKGLVDVGLSKVGLSGATKTFDQKKALLNYQLAKLAEYGKLTGGRGISDKQIEYFEDKIMNMGIVGFQGPIDEQIHNLKRDFLRINGIDPDTIPALKTQPKENTSWANPLPEINSETDNLRKKYNY